MKTRSALSGMTMACVACFMGATVAQTVAAPPPMPKADIKMEPRLEPIPEPVASSSPAVGDPEVKVIRRGGDRIEEFRAKGRLYMVRVYPAIGLPYTLVDERGDGVFNRKDPRGTPMTPAQWKVLSW